MFLRFVSGFGMAPNPLLMRIFIRTDWSNVNRQYVLLCAYSVVLYSSNGVATVIRAKWSAIRRVGTCASLRARRCGHDDGSSAMPADLRARRSQTRFPIRACANNDLLLA